MDSAPYHTSKHTVEWLKKNKIDFIPKIEWPACSPDINPIENLWGTIQSRIIAKNPKNIATLKRMASLVWNALSEQEISKYITSLTKRYADIIKSKGEQTKH